jgi:predicted GIY-YIG superfamily endonuclease
MNVTIEFDKKFETVTSGVYMMGFSNGYFYIGASKYLPTRLYTHERMIRNDFKLSSTPKSLKIMSGFEGIVTFTLLEEVDIKWRRFGLPGEIVKREMFYKKLYYNEEYMLNLIKHLV